MTDPSSRCGSHKPAAQSSFSTSEIISVAAILAVCSLPFLAHALVRRGANNRRAGQQRSSNTARLSNTVSVRGVGRGNPSLSVGDGHELVTSYTGSADLQEALEQNLAEPLSLT